MRIDKIGARYSVSQSSSVAALIFNKVLEEIQPRSSTPAALYFFANRGKTSTAILSATSSVSMVLQVP